MFLHIMNVVFIVLYVITYNMYCRTLNNQAESSLSSSSHLRKLCKKLRNGYDDNLELANIIKSKLNLYY